VRGRIGQRSKQLSIESAVLGLSMLSMEISQRVLPSTVARQLVTRNHSVRPAPAPSANISPSP
jgi:hypothetical protein